MEKNEQIVKKEIELLQQNRAIILFAAGGAGILMKRYLDKMGIEVAGFCDNKAALQGSMVGDVPVYSMEKIRENYPEALIIKCSFYKPSLESITQQLVVNGYNDSIECLAIFYALKIGWREDYLEGRLIQWCEDIISGTEQSIFLRSIEFDITEKCTLRCKDCANLIPYFSNPQNYDAGDIIASIKKLAASVKGIGRLTLLGGEPFLHTGLIKIIKAVAEIENIMLIQVTTNGTLIPSANDLAVMGKYVSYVVISDYGELSRKRDQLIKSLRDHNIIYEIRGQGRIWYSVGGLDKRNRTIEENSAIFQKCQWAKNCLSVLKGEMRLCPHANYGTILGAMPKNPLDYVNILDATKTPEEIGEMVKRLLTDSQYITACDYCNGTTDAEEVEPAVQVKEAKWQYKAKGARK